MCSEKRTYTKEFKQEAVRLYATSSKSARQSESGHYAWRRRQPSVRVVGEAGQYNFAKRLKR
jgi:hypothetical protein